MTESLRVLLDSNVVFSAARDQKSNFRKFWHLPSVEIITSKYIIGEVSEHLTSVEQRASLWQLLSETEIVPDGDDVALPPSILLPQKAQPILRSAIAGRANILVTGDKNHFGALFGTTVATVLIQSSSDFKSRYPDIFGSSRT